MKIEVLGPLENGKVVFQRIAPRRRTEAEQGRVSVRLRITNDSARVLEINRVGLLGQTIASSQSIAPGKSVTMQNFEGRARIIEAPFSSTGRIEVFLKDQDRPVEAKIDLAPHVNDGGPLLWPGTPTDLRQNEAWDSDSRHWTDHQVFALDTRILGWNVDRWSPHFPGPLAAEREHFRAYGMPVYAMADGTVCWALNDHEERRSIYPAPTISKSLGVFSSGGNVVFVKQGDEIALYAHLQIGSVPAELMQFGSPVRKGQYLGKVGLSGASKQPHLHIHVKKEARGLPRAPRVEANGCDAGEFRPMAFGDIQSLTVGEAQLLAAEGLLKPSDWAKLTNHSAPNEAGLLYPSSAAFSFDKGYTDTRRYVGVWRSGTFIQLRVKAAGWDAFAARWSELTNDRFRLLKVKTAVKDGRREFFGVFNRGVGNHLLWNAAGWDAFTKKWAEVSQAGLRLSDVTVYGEGEGRRFVGVFQAGSDAHALTSTKGWQAFTAQVDDQAKNGLRLVDLESFSLPDGDRQYVGVFRQGAGHALWHTSGWDSFSSKCDELSSAGLRLVALDTFVLGTQRRYVGVFHPGTGGGDLRAATGYEQFFEASERLNGAGLRLVDLIVHG